MSHSDKKVYAIRNLGFWYDQNLDYLHQNHLLTISPDEKTLNSVNALLKKPLYEIRYLTIQEIYEIEQSLNQTPTHQ